MLYKIGEVHFRLLSTNGFHMKANDDRFTAAGCRRQNLKYDWKFHVVVWQTTSKNRAKKRAPRAAWLFFLVQPIKSFICGVVVVVLIS